MKQQLKKWIAVTGFMLLVFTGMAQQNKKSPAWLPENGYWIVESNLHTPKNHIVRFYTLDNVLIYSEIARMLVLQSPVLLMTGFFSMKDFRLRKSSVYRQIHRRVKSFFIAS